MNKFAVPIILYLIGAGLLWHASSLEAYDEVSMAMLKMADGLAEISTERRASVFTAKYQLFDWGVSLTAVSGLMLFLMVLGKGDIKSLPSKKALVGFALLLPVVTVAGFLFDMYQGVQRGYYPHWSDDMKVPFIYVPIGFMVLMIWSLSHSSIAKQVTSLPLLNKTTFTFHPWFLLNAALALVAILASVFAGMYWYAVPAAMWMYYFLSLGAAQITNES